jgi:hypothetical protein
MDHPRPARQDFAGASLKVELDEALTAALKTLGQRHGTTLFMTLLAGWAAVLARLSGQDEVVVGTPSANRGRSEIEGLIGFFVNTLALRVDLSGSPSVAELLGRVKERSLGAQHHQDIPFEQVVELVQPVRSLAHTPLFQVMFAWQNAPGGSLELPGLALGPLDPAGSGGSSSQVTAKFDLSLALWEDGGRIEGAVEYATALFERATVERWLGYLRRVLEGMVADDAGAGGSAGPALRAERRRVVEEFNDRRVKDPREAFVHEQFEAQVERTPGAAALVFEDETLSYAELNARANRLAHHLRALGVGPDARVALCVERGLEMVVGVLAVLKAGGAYRAARPRVSRRAAALHAGGRRARGTPHRARAAPPVRRRHAPRGRARGTGRGVGRAAGQQPGARRAGARTPGVRDLHLRLHRPSQGRARVAREPRRHAGRGGGSVRVRRRRARSLAGLLRLRHLAVRGAPPPAGRRHRAAGRRATGCRTCRGWWRISPGAPRCTPCRR